MENLQHEFRWKNSGFLNLVLVAQVERSGCLSEVSTLETIEKVDDMVLVRLENESASDDHLCISKMGAVCL